MIKFIVEFLSRIFNQKGPVPPYRPDVNNAPVTSLGLPRAIVKAMEDKGYPIDKGEGEVNIVYLEGCDVDGSLNDDAPDRFNDTRICLSFVEGNPVVLGAWEATTEPGKYWTQNRMNPLGAARIRFGHYKAWIVGLHNGDHEALVQRKGTVTVHRDDNEDFLRAGDVLQTGYFGINQHHGYDNPKNSLGRSSAGCLVGRSIKGHREFMKIVTSDPRYRRDPNFVFSTTIMDARDVVS